MSSSLLLAFQAHLSGAAELPGISFNSLVVVSGVLAAILALPVLQDRLFGWQRSGGPVAATRWPAMSPAVVACAAEAASQVASTVSAPAPRAESSGNDRDRSEVIPETHMTLIAAAVANAFGRRARIRSVTHDYNRSIESRQWAHEGRRDIFASHRIR
ncbi:hypothetical protein OpiT1DRAFT_03602 [Opitutaceae bacterium TAV1]|nr:hypothetical protein OpiT1DRAFT_03602 [Opitutaceae bacterium TAV1]